MNYEVFYFGLLEQELFLTVWEQAGISSISCQWFFSRSQVISSYTYPNQYSAEDWRQILLQSSPSVLLSPLWDIPKQALGTLALSGSYFQFLHSGWSLGSALVPLPGLLPETSMYTVSWSDQWPHLPASCFTRISLLCKVLESFVSYIVFQVLVVSGQRVSPVPVTPSWLEVPFLLIFKLLYILRTSTFHLSYILRAGSNIEHSLWSQSQSPGQKEENQESTKLIWVQSLS